MATERTFTKELVWIYCVGITGMMIPYTRPLFQIITPVNLLVVTALLLYNHRQWDVRTIVSLTLIGLLSWFVEAIGVNTGLIFGEYAYGPTLGPGLMNTPLMIGVNWIVLVYVCHSVAVMALENIPAKNIVSIAYRKTPPVMAAFLGAIIMVGYDIILEPSAIELNMWTWAGGKIPLQNYVAWFLFSFVFILFIGISRVDTRNKTALPVLLTQLVFFAILDIYFLLF